MPGGRGGAAVIKAVAFDLDSTLVDFLRYKRIAVHSAALAMVDAGLDMDPSIAAERLWDVYKTENLDGDTAFDRFLECTVGIVDVSVREAGIRAYLRAKDAHLEPYPGTVRTLIELVRKDLVLAVVTDARRHKALGRLHALRLAPFFDIIITGDDTPNGKSDESPYRQLLARLGARPDQVLMVGDNPARDVKPAKRLGMHTALAAYGSQPHFATAFPEDVAEFELQDIGEVVEVVDGLARRPRHEATVDAAGEPVTEAAR